MHEAQAIRQGSPVLLWIPFFLKRSPSFLIDRGRPVFLQFPNIFAIARAPSRFRTTPETYIVTVQPIKHPRTELGRDSWETSKNYTRIGGPHVALSTHYSSRLFSLQLSYAFWGTGGRMDKRSDGRSDGRWRMHARLDDRTTVGRSLGYPQMSAPSRFDVLWRS